MAKRVIMPFPIPYLFEAKQNKLSSSSLFFAAANKKISCFPISTKLFVYIRSHKLHLSLSFVYVCVCACFFFYWNQTAICTLH